MNRIKSIDLLRGIAVLGILIMNIQSFSMPSAAYINPSAYGDLTGINKWIWIVSHLFADLKFMGLFSMLFGAGIILMTDKLKSTDRPVASTWHLRNFLLLVFGCMHVAFLWEGDILIMYAICGFITYFLRNKAPKTLFRVAVFFFIIPVLMSLFQGLSWDHIPAEAIANINDSWHPSTNHIQETIGVMTGDSFSERLNLRIEHYIGLLIYYFLSNGLWRIMAMMLFGMYFYKKGIVTASRDTSFYTKTFFTCILIGLTLSGVGVLYNFNHGWLAQHSFFLGSLFNYIGSLFTIIAYLCIVMLWSKSNMWEGLQSLFQKVGKMAFTNYILMSAICTFIFNRLGYFGEIERWQQFLIVLVVWMIIFIFTSFWFKRFKMGPLEWIWRSLTYRKWATI